MGHEQVDVGSQFDDRGPLKQEHCVLQVTESMLRDSEDPVAAVARVHSAEALSLVVSASTVNAPGVEVKNSLIDCVDEVKCSVINVGSGGPGEPQSEFRVARSSGQVVRLFLVGT